MNILVQFPTYHRADKFLSVFDRYVTLAGDTNKLYFNINCDTADHTMNNSYVKERILFVASKKDNIGFKVNYDDNTTKISAINNHIPGSGFDIVVCASDDMVPQVRGWDNDITDAMQQYFPNLDGCVHFNDGHTGNELITFSILGRSLYEQFGYIYHPDYKSLYCDNEFTDVVKSMGKVQYVDNIIVSHEHWSIAGTQNHNNVDLAVQKTLHHSGRDRVVYEKRKLMSYPQERITND